MARERKEVGTGKEMAKADESGVTKSLATICRAGWSCLVEALGTGATGAGAEAGAELFTQHGLSQTQRLQQDAGRVWPSAFVGSTDCVTASNKLNKMANVAFNQSTLLFGFRLGFVEFLHVLGGIFLEIF
jgi:hypothetical protein